MHDPEAKSRPRQGFWTAGRGAGWGMGARGRCSMLPPIPGEQTPGAEIQAVERPRKQAMASTGGLLATCAGGRVMADVPRQNMAEAASTPSFFWACKERVETPQPTWVLVDCAREHDTLRRRRDAPVSRVEQHEKRARGSSAH